MRLSETQKKKILIDNKYIIDLVFHEMGHASTNGDTLLTPKQYKCCEGIVKPEETGMTNEHHKFTLYNHSKSFTHKFYEINDEHEFNLSEQEIQNLIKCFKFLKTYMKKFKIESLDDAIEIMQIELDFY